jgi:aminoglycoside phosphotransferase (APT) family kinase protein
MQNWFLVKADSGLLPNWQCCTKATLEEILRSLPEPLVLRAEPAARGTFHEIFELVLREERVALRVSSILGLESVKVEQWAAEEAARAGVPTAVPTRVGMKNEVSFALMPWVEGKPFTLQHADVVGKALRSLHSIRMTGFGPVALTPAPAHGRFQRWIDFLTTNLEEHLSVCVKTGAMSVEEARTARGIVASAVSFEVEAPTLLHGDLTNPNLICQENGSVMVMDWEDCLVGDYVFELAGWCAFHMPGEFKVLIDAYFAGEKRPDSFIQRFWLYYARIVLARTVVRHIQGKTDNPGMPPASRRIQIALSEWENNTLI